ncbi:MAG: HAD family hydrolase [Betaproteobacteria bacterium]|nr:HAD family hydrolase [Betaproteobacteria bacterium]MBI2508456.1 HAD family hydrolase [Betaproteobacteria bacterium]
MTARLALFDLDDTLLAGDSDFEWAQFLIERNVLDREVYAARNQSFYEQYKAGTLDIREFLDFQLKPLSRHPRPVLEAWHREYMERRIRPIVRRGARPLVERHRDDLRVVITATNSFVTAPIAREFGIDNLIATEPEERDGEFTGGVAGVPCFREGKVRRLESWLAARGRTLASFGESWFYSDSHNDLPLLERVTHPVAVAPDDELRAHAARRGWTIISLD